MTKLNNHIRSQLITRLKESAGYREHLDLSSFLFAGITQAEIGIVDYAQDQLSKCPYLEEKDFIDKGISVTQINAVLGGFDNFKKLLGVQDYGFSDWLSGQDLSRGLAIPYFLYQKFMPEIREHYMDDCRIVDYLTIELNNSKQYRDIPILDVCRAAIPATDLETLGVASLLLCNEYQYVAVDKEQCVLTLECRKTYRQLSVEAKCLSTQFCHCTDLSVCVIDDLIPVRNAPKVREVLVLQDLIH